MSMEFEQKKRQNLKAHGFKPRTKKPCDPKWFSKIEPGSMHYELFMKDTDKKQNE